jgi:hypothetical protein
LKKGAKLNIKNFNPELIYKAYKAFSIKGEELGKGLIKFMQKEHLK